MNLIPVLDLMQGHVVRAVRGNREAYRPIVSRLCAGSDPVNLAQALCEHCASGSLYIADLDALRGGPAQVHVLRAVLDALPDVELWLDAGFADAAAARALGRELGSELGRELGRGLGNQVGASQSRLVPVFGSESLASRAALEACFSGADADRAVLSLDRRDGERLDAAGCWDLPQAWPKRVIVMTLERVGADSGPDLETLAEVRRKSPATLLIGAGGIRDAADLARAEAAGAAAWLVASALHDGRLPRVGA